jgi:hypothetical protein
MFLRFLVVHPAYPYLRATLIMTHDQGIFLGVGAGVFTAGVTIVGAAQLASPPSNLWTVIGLALAAIGLLTALTAAQKPRAKPTTNVVFTRTRQDPLYARDKAGNVIHDQPIHFTQLWFRNDGGTMAANVTATVELSQDGIAVRRQRCGWVRTTAPDHMGHSWPPLETIDIWPNDEEVKLLFLAKHAQDANVYVAGLENFHAYPDGRHPNFLLPPSRYQVMVQLRGGPFSDRYYFELNTLTDTPTVRVIPAPQP